LRELLESLPIVDQLRAVIVIAVMSSILLLHAIMAAHQVWSARQRAIDLALQSATGEADLLGMLAKLRGVSSVTILLPSGEVFGHSARTTGESAQEADSLMSDSTAPTGGGWLRSVGEVLAVRPTVLWLPVQLSEHGAATAIVTLNQFSFWAAAFRQLGTLPLTLPIGFLIALLAANSLKRQIVEPLSQLASSTRVGTWAGAVPPPVEPAGRSELTELATNFDALTSRLAAYERDLRNVRQTAARKIVEQTRATEQRLKAADAMTRAKDDFLANMSHEIRTPMNGVLGMTELLASTNLDKRQRRFVDSMRTAAETMMQIINAILDDSKIEAGKMDLVSEPFDVRRLMEDVAQLYAGAAESKQIELICRIEPSVPRVAVGDVLRLRQILGNLLSNAVKYTERGEVQIRAAADEPSDGICRVHFSVADSGPGIPESQHATVFQAFTQLENATRIGGTGLGLSIANRLVKLMGGDAINLRSEPGHGSTFSFVLPFEVSEEVDSSAADDSDFAGLRVLVVDDNSSSYMQLEETLNEWKVEATVVNRGRVMLDRLRSAALRSSPFDLVLIDHSLPDMTAAEMLRALRTDPVTSSTYAVLMTALAFEADEGDDRSIEPDECIPKPVPLELLKRCLQTVRTPRVANAAAAGGGSGVRGPDPVLLGLDVLVVDDNAVNREVAVAMLEDRRCKVAVAADGRSAVSQASSRRFDVILMDCQMPVMDGFTAAMAIRREESSRGTQPTPIVALTANVMARDRDRCTAAGMDHFLAKPFTAAQLENALRPIAQARGTLQAAPIAERSSTPHPASEPVARAAKRLPSVPLEDPAVLDMLDAPLFAPAETPPAAATPRGVLDREQIEVIRGLGKPSVLEKLCALLFASAPAALQSIEQALAAGDLAAIADAAHSLKSSCANLGGRQLAAQLDRCEMAARETRDIEQVRTAAVGLKQGYAALAAALAQEIQHATGTG
jgi:signal transduction histidine kinase/CheY-like chemotaxis protein